MTLKNCTPPDWWNDSAALPTTATLRLEWQRSGIGALMSDIKQAVCTGISVPSSMIDNRGMDIETAGEPDEWACPPRVCPECDSDVLPDNYCIMGHLCGQ